MAGLARKFLKIFGVDNPSRIGVFGSLAEGSPTTSVNPETIQSLDAYSDGWGAAVDPLGGTPAEQDFNGLDYLLTYQLAYLLEKGIGEWNSQTTYFIGSFVSDGAGNIYKSLQDTNLNHVITDAAWWALAGGFGLKPVAVSSTGTIEANTQENVDVSGGTVTRTLPPLPTSGQVPISVLILDTGSASETNKVQIAPASGELIDLPDFVANDGVALNAPHSWSAFYGVPGASSWKVQMQANSLVPAAGDDIRGTVSYENYVTKTSALAGGTTTPNVTVKQSRVGKQVAITLLASGLVTKSASPGQLSVAIDPDFTPPVSITFEGYGVVNAVSGVYLWIVDSAGLIRLYGNAAGNNIAANTTNCGWDQNLTFTYSVY